MHHHSYRSSNNYRSILIRTRFNHQIICIVPSKYNLILLKSVTQRVRRNIRQSSLVFIYHLSNLIFKSCIFRPSTIPLLFLKSVFYLFNYYFYIFTSKLNFLIIDSFCPSRSQGTSHFFTSKYAWFSFAYHLIRLIFKTIRSKLKKKYITTKIKYIQMICLLFKRLSRCSSRFHWTLP